MNPTNILYRFKIIMTGDDNVGKSCLLYRYMYGSFPKIGNYNVGVHFNDQILEVEPGVRVKLQIVDTAGHESFCNDKEAASRNTESMESVGVLLKSYNSFVRINCYAFPQSAGCLLVFDLCNYKSFTCIKHRYTEVCNRVNPYTVLFVLVGNMCDRKEQEVNEEEVEEFARELGAPYIKASAKTGHNVAEVFELVTRRIYQGYLNGEVHLHESWGKVH